MLEQALAELVRLKAQLGDGKGSNGEIYRFSPDTRGGAHFSGMTGADGLRIRPESIPIMIRRLLGVLK